MKVKTKVRGGSRGCDDGGSSPGGGGSGPANPRPVRTAAVQIEERALDDLELAPRYWLATRARLDAVQLERELGPLDLPASAPAAEQPAAG